MINVDLKYKMIIENIIRFKWKMKEKQRTL